MNITQRLAKTISNYQDPNSLGSFLRKQRSRKLRELIERIYAANRSVKILDVGGTRNYWNIFPLDWLKNNNVNITLLNLEPLSEHLENEIFSFVIGDGRCIQFSDKSFDICHSNSVIEHVGDFENMKIFAKEISRVGKNYYVQTPSFWFPIEPHAMFPFFHWLPAKVRVKIVLNYSIGHWKKARSQSEAWQVIKSAQLLKKNDLLKLFPDSTYIYTERIVFPKSYIVVKG